MSMASVPGSINQGTPFPREPFVFPSSGNVGLPYIATLTLPGLTIGLPIWLFSTPFFSNAPSVSNVNPPSEECQPHVDPFPSSPVASYSFSSSCLVKSLLLLTRRLRRRRIIRRRRKISKGENNQLLLGELRPLRSLPPQLASQNTLAGFVRVTTFFVISLAFPRY
jgi:hypothetical protein